MADPSDTSLSFYTKATPAQWSYVLSKYQEVLKLKAAQRRKKGGPEELIRLDAWYHEQLPTIIHSRKQPHITHEELIQITKWKLIRGKFRPCLMDLVRINTETAVLKASKKAFRKIPNMTKAINALTCLKGIGPASASAILAAGYPEHAPFMADESMLSTPGIETTDSTLAEYVNYTAQIKACSDRLNEHDKETKWTPHKVELALWTHFLARELKPSILDDLPKSDEDATPNGKSSNNHSDKDKSEDHDALKQIDQDDSSNEPVNKNIYNAHLNIGEDSEISNSSLEATDEPPSKKPCI